VFRPLLPDASRLARRVAAGKTRRLALVGAIALVTGTLYAALAQAASASAPPLWGAAGRALGKLLASGHFAVIWWPRLALSIGVLAVLARRDVTGLAGDLALAAMPAILLTSSLGSHAAAVQGWSPLAIAADWLHFMAVAAWLGGLASMVVVLPAVARAVNSRQGAFFARPVARFSNVALVCVVAVALTGTFQACLELGSWQALVQTAYGLSVSAKVVLTVVMLGFGTFNLLFAHPRLAARLASRLSAMRWTVRGFGRSIRAELAIGLVVLGVAAVLTGLAPGRGDLARQTGAQPSAVDEALNAPGVSGRVRITPAAVGQNHFSVELSAADPTTVGARHR
jgi:putative copper export protein